MVDRTYPVIGDDAGHFPADFVCPVCGGAKVGEPHSFAGISGGALVMDVKGDSVHGVDGHKGFLALFFHGAHPEMGGEGVDPDKGGHVRLVDDSKDGQFDLMFCSTTCMRRFFDECIDELERRVAIDDVLVELEPKKPVTVEVPRAFAEFMQQVNHLIVIGDDATTIESYDLLRCDCAYGGLGSDGKRFDFSYAHHDGGNWDIELTANQIAAVANGTLAEFELWKCPNETCLCYHAAKNHFCRHCDLTDSGDI